MVSLNVMKSSGNGKKIKKVQLVFYVKEKNPYYLQKVKKNYVVKL